MLNEYRDLNGDKKVSNKRDTHKGTHVYLIDWEKAVSNDQRCQSGDGERRYEVARVSIPLQTPQQNKKVSVSAVLQFTQPSTSLNKLFQT